MSKACRLFPAGLLCLYVGTAVSIQAEESRGRQMLTAVRSGDWAKAEALAGLRTGLSEWSNRVSGAEPTTITPLELRLRLELLDRRGRYEEAQRTARTMLDLRARDGSHVPGVLEAAAVAAGYLQEWELANDLFRDGAEAPNPTLSLYLDWGRLYLEKYNPAEALELFQEALEADAEPLQRWTPADVWVGVAQARIALGQGDVEEALENARALADGYPPVKAQEIYLQLREGRWEDSLKAASSALAEHPEDLELLRYRATALYFLNRSEQYQAALADLEAVNPRDGRFFELLGNLSVFQRSLDEAVKHFSRALELMPNLWSALASRGINRLRLGEEEAGVADLEEVYANDPYNVWAVNTLRLVDSFSNFVLLETERFRIRLHKKEVGVLGPYVREVLDRSLEDLERSYGHQVPFKILFEMYPDHEDFAVRTLGLPGLGALGATVGRLVVMDSPSARPPGTFHWASTLRHELSHAVALELSRHRVSRWFTEGLSMVEERRGGRGWGDPLPVAVVQAYRRDEIPGLQDLESLFLNPKRPEDLTIAYHIAAEAIAYLEGRFGREKIPQLLQAYGEGLGEVEVFDRVLNTPLEEIDRAFRSSLDVLLGPPARYLRPVEPRTDDEQGLRTALEKAPDSFVLRTALGAWLLEHNRPQEAAVELENAVALFPEAVQPGGVYELLLQAYRAQRDRTGEKRTLERWWARYPVPADNALRLSELYLEEGEREEARNVLEEALWSATLSPEVHRRLGRLYLEEDRPEHAIREFEVLLAAGPTDEARVRFELARAYFAVGNRQRAKREVLLALEIAPSFEEAQRFLLEVTRP